MGEQTNIKMDRQMGLEPEKCKVNKKKKKSPSLATFLKVSLYICLILSPLKQKQRLQTCFVLDGLLRTHLSRGRQEEPEEAIAVSTEGLAQQHPLHCAISTQE